MAANKSDITAMNNTFFLIILVMSLNDISIKIKLLPAFAKISRKAQILHIITYYIIFEIRLKINTVNISGIPTAIYFFKNNLCMQNQPIVIIVKIQQLLISIFVELVYG